MTKLSLSSTARFKISGALIFLNISIFIFAVLLIAHSWSYRHLLPVRYLSIFMLSFCLVSFFTLNVFTATSLEDKILFSRLRYIGFSFLAQSGLLFFSAALKRWDWLHSRWMRGLLFAPGIVTILITLGFFDSNLLVHSHALFQYLGVSVLTFENGPWFSVQYSWNMFSNFLVIALLIQSLILDKEKRGQISILSLGIFAGSIVDIYCVATNSPLRWLMLSAGTFVIAEFSIWYVSSKYDLLGVLSSDKNERAKLKESMEFQRKMLGLLAHDLSGNIHQQAHLAQFLRKKLQDNHNDVLNTWSESAQASSDLIGNIMRWIKTQEAEFKPQIASVDIHPLLSSCIENVQLVFADRKVDIKIEAPANPYFVKCDPEMMASIMRNLLSNAIKASQDGKQAIIRITEHGSRIRLGVHDQGHGMSPEKIRSLWNNKNMKSGGSGYGFGLILANHFVELHQGQLEIESTPAVGTQIYFSIPL